MRVGVAVPSQEPLSTSLTYISAARKRKTTILLQGGEPGYRSAMERGDSSLIHNTMKSKNGTALGVEWYVA